MAPKIIAVYTGGGPAGLRFPGVPARDLTDDDLGLLMAKNISLEVLVASGAFEEPKPAKPKKAKKASAPAVGETGTGDSGAADLKED